MRTHARAHTHTHTRTLLLLLSHPSHVWLFVTPWTAARQASLSLTVSGSLLKFMLIALVMPSCIYTHTHICICMYVCRIYTHMYAYIYKCVHIYMLLLLSCFSRVRLCATPATAAHQAPLSLHIHMYIIEQNAKSTWMCKIKQENFVWGLHSLQLWHMFLFSSSSKCYCKGCFRLRIIYWELSMFQVLCWVIYTHITSYSPSLQILCILCSYAPLEMSKWMYDHLW